MGGLSDRKWTERDQIPRDRGFCGDPSTGGFEWMQSSKNLAGITSIFVAEHFQEK